MLYSVLGGWLVYLRYHSYDVANGRFWELHARNLATGKDILLDSPQLEGLPSMPQGASSDGRSVAWVTWTKGPNGGTCLTRAYNVATGVGQIVTGGGFSNTWAWKYASISGNRIALEQDDYIHNRSEIVVLDTATGRTVALTNGSTFQSEPWISGNLVVWKNGSAGSQGTGVWVHNLATEKRILVRSFDTESPHAVAGRYVVFPVSKQSDDRYEAIRLYDTATGTDSMLFTPNHGWGVGNWVGTGQHSVVFQNGKTGKRNQSLLTVVRLR